MHSMRGVGDQGSRWRCLGDTLRSCPRPPRFRCVPTSRGGKLRRTPHKHHHRLSQRPGPRIRCTLMSKCKKLRSAPPRVHYRSSQRPGPRLWYVPTARGKNYAPPRHRHRISRTPGLRIRCTLRSTCKKCWTALTRPHHQQTQRPRQRIRCFLTLRGKKLQSAPPVDIVIGYSEQLDHIFKN